MRTRHTWKLLAGVMLGLAMLVMPAVAGAACGDGLPDIGEECDPGPDVPGDCCDAACLITSATPAFVCRPAASVCDVAEVCDGVSAACPADSAAGVFVECRPAGDECDPAENCDGVNPNCPADQIEPDGTSCDSGDVCSIPDVCSSGVCAPSSGDADTDNVCDASDNCPADANPGQEDLDGDSDGDVCDTDDGPLNPIKINFRLDTAGPTFDNSLVRVKGDFVTLDPSDVFDASAPLTLVVSDGKSPPGTPTVRSHTFPTSSCLTQTRKISCVDGEYRISFLTSPARPGVWKFRARFKKQTLSGPLQGPATAVLTYGPSTDRIGSVADCKVKFSGMSCKDFK
jgi:hypothetical protein